MAVQCEEQREEEEERGWCTVTGSKEVEGEKREGL